MSEKDFPSWREQLLRQADARDRCTQGLQDLYEQYSECLRGLQACGASGPGGGGPSSAGASPRPGPAAWGAGSADGDASAPASDDVAGARASRTELAAKKQLEALSQLLAEREEELGEKEEAHATVCRQATLLSRENAELKAQLERTQEQLQRKVEETDRLLSELQLLREAEAVWQNKNGGGRALPEEPVLPMKRRIFRKVHDAEITCVAAAGSQGAPLPRKLVAMGAADGFVELLDGETMRPHARLKVSKEAPRIVAVDLTPGIGRLLAASADHALRLLDLRVQKQLFTLRGHTDGLTACGFLKGNAQAYTASLDRTVKLWDLEKGHTLRSIPATSAVMCAAVHQSSGMIVTGHGDGTVAVWDPRSSDRLSIPTRVHQNRGLVGVRIAPDGRSLLSQADDGVVCVTAMDAMRTLNTLSGLGPVAWPSAPAFSLDGAQVLARGVNQITCWDVGSGKVSCSHEGQAPLCVCWDLPQAVSAHAGGHAALWGTEEGL